ncbi:histidine phosphatase family protein [Streptomyces sp. NPDC021093]|uniref:histidine phosphatase family protein n=1 Tax=Streptomyces sp. NPDC021093 TaxID=3365112 RepID=UPI003788B96E
MPRHPQQEAAEAPATAAPAAGWGPARTAGPPTTLLLLRHGETALTPEKRFSGSGGTNPPLSAAGIRQARSAATAFAARGAVQDIVCSPLLRCRQTASATAELLGLEAIVEPGLREADFGAWEGLTFDEVRERHPADLAAWQESPTAAPTGGESFAEVADRVAAARDLILARHRGRTVLVVTHVVPVKTLVRLAMGAPPEAVFRLELAAAALSEISYPAEGGPSVRLVNSTAHLGSLNGPTVRP